MSEKVGGIYYDLDLDDSKFRKKIPEASSKMAGLKNTFSKVEDASKSLGLKLGLIVTAVGGLAVKAVNTAGMFESLGVSLETAFQGNKKAARDAQKQIVDFTAKTPYQLQQVTDAFIKLKNYGLNNSEKAMKAYGDTASALGKDLNQMVEAVADASTGEFERLKEFGIKSKKEGDKVSFTFRGTTKTIGNSSKEIQDYLIKLGETNFGGGMAKQSNTLKGKLSNLQDAFELTMSKIAEDSGLLDFAKQAIDRIIGSFEWLTKEIKNAGGVMEFLKAKIQEFQAELIGIATAITIALLPAIISWISAAAPLIGLVAVAAAIGYGIYRVIDAFGGLQGTIDAFKAAFEVVKQKLAEIWSKIWPIIEGVLKFLAPSFERLKKTVMEELWPALQVLWKALQDLWALISPAILPILKVLGVVLGVILVGAIWLFINILNILVKIIRIVILALASMVYKSTEGWHKMVQGVADFVTNIKKKANDIKEGIIKPFREAFEWLKEKVKEAKKSLDKLNPFHRESPSLVDWVTKGTKTMTNLYEGMFDNVGNMAAQGRVGLIGASSGLSRAVDGSNGSPLSGNSYSISINPSGIITRNRSELRSVAGDLLDAINEDLVSRGIAPLGKSKIRTK